ncbi:MAG: hypothetical protein R2708_24135 [Vicinamibacterales bacterium]
MRHVWVNGVQVLKDGEHTGATPGRVDARSWMEQPAPSRERRCDGTHATGPEAACDRSSRAAERSRTIRDQPAAAHLTARQG